MNVSTVAPGFESAGSTELPLGAEGHFRLHMFALLTRLLGRLGDTTTTEEEGGVLSHLPFLAGYRDALEAYRLPELSIDAELDLWDERIAALEARTRTHLPLRALIRELGLSLTEARILLAVGLVEEDIRFGALFAGMQQPLAARRPCIGVLGWLVGEDGALPFDAWPACQGLIRAGLVVAENRGEPRSEWLLRVPQPIWDALRCRPSSNPSPGLTLQMVDTLPALEGLILPTGIHDQVRRLPALLTSGQVRTIVLRGMGGVGRRTVLATIAQALGRSVLQWDPSSAGGQPGDDTWRLLGPLATLMGAMPVLRCDPGPGESLELPELPGYHGPVGITLGRSGGLRGPMVEHALALTLPPPVRSERLRVWHTTGVPIAPDQEDEIAGRFLLTAGHIHRAARLGQPLAALDGRPEVSVHDVHAATRALNRQVLDTLATQLEPVNGWSDVIVGPTTARELGDLEARCRRREALPAAAGPAFDRQLNRGVRALFSGPSGTGKTLAARSLAAALRMDLYRVDLAAVVNKYIGETERNLNQVLSRAEELDVLLLLDEGDALMTARTDVRNANDRYANLETNYLLQRLEAYEGIVIVTTNAAKRIDDAFRRRIDAIIEFSPPDPTERWLIWQSHLPRGHVVGATTLHEVVVRCALTGGQIRNAALHATLLALSDGRPVEECHLLEATRHEYRKAGAAYPMRNALPPLGHLERVRRFAAELG